MRYVKFKISYESIEEKLTKVYSVTATLNFIVWKKKRERESFTEKFKYRPRFHARWMFHGDNEYELAAKKTIINGLPLAAARFVYSWLAENIFLMIDRFNCS